VRRALQASRLNGRSFRDDPFELRSKFVETLLANPAVSIVGAIAFVKQVRIVANHEFGETKFAVIVVIARIGRSIRSPTEMHSMQMPLLIPETPIWPNKSTWSTTLDGSEERLDGGKTKKNNSGRLPE
jgi:hypothetical protein